MNLLDHFYRIHKTSWGGLLAALEALNQSLGTNYSNNTLARWKRGAIPVPQPVQAYMRGIVLTQLHKEHGGERFTLTVLRDLIEACEPPTVGAKAEERPRSFSVSSAFPVSFPLRDT